MCDSTEDSCTVNCSLKSHIFGRSSHTLPAAGAAVFRPRRLAAPQDEYNVESRKIIVDLELHVHRDYS